MADMLGVNLATEADKLIGDNPQDKLLQKVNELRMALRTEKERKNFQSFSTCYYNTFLTLAQRHFGLGHDLLKSDEFDKGMILALENLLRKRAKKWYYIFSAPVILPLWLIPIAGWILLVFLCDKEMPRFNTSRKFILSRNALEKLGQDPQEYILQALGKGKSR